MQSWGVFPTGKTHELRKRMSGFLYCIKQYHCTRKTTRVPSRFNKGILPLVNC